jgi:hypothetical protein
MYIHHLARPRPIYCLLRGVPRRSDLSLTAMQACSGWCPPATPTPHRLLNALSDLHRPLRRTKCASIPNGVCFQHLFLTAPLIYLYASRWESPPYTSAQFSVPDNWKSGRIWVRIFSFLPNSFTARAWLHSLPDFCGRARALLFGGFQGRRDCNFSTTAGVNSCLDGGCNGGLQCDPHTGTVRLSPTIFAYTQLTHTLCLPFPLSPPSPGAMQGVPPATVAEWTLQSNGSQDFYDGARETFIPISPPLIRKRPD